MMILGQGKYARVYAGDDIGPAIALKVLVDYQHTAMREIVFLTMCAHHNVCVLVDCGVVRPDDAPPIITLSLQRHRCSLYDSWSHGRAAAPNMRTIINQCGDLAVALAHVHACGVIHADIKPSNLLIADDGRLVLCDFGLSVLRAEPKHTLTVVADAYRAPEFETCGGVYDAPLDVWSAGVVMIEICRGRTIDWATRSKDARNRAAQLFGVSMTAMPTSLISMARLSSLCMMRSDPVHGHIASALTPSPSARITAAALAERFGRGDGTNGAVDAIGASTPNWPTGAVTSADPATARLIEMLVPPAARPFAHKLHGHSPIGQHDAIACALIAGALTKRARRVYQSVISAEDETDVCMQAVDTLRAWRRSVTPDGKK